MATASDIINRSLRLIGALESGETPEAQETADALSALNAMLESWRLERLMVYAMQDVTHVLVPNDGSYTIAASGADIAEERPIRIDSAYVTDSDTDIPVQIIDKAAWDRIEDKTVTSSYPSLLYYEAAYPKGVIHLWPIPSANNTLTLSLWTTLDGLATAGTTFAFPPGYRRAIEYNLAVELAPEWQLEVPNSVLGIAVNSKAAIKRANATPIISQIEPAGSGLTRNIYTDGL